MRPFRAALLALGLADCAPATVPARSVPLPVAPRTTLTCEASIAVPGDPNGLFWDAPRERLIIADSTHDRLLVWKAGETVSVLAELPEAARSGLGQPVMDGEDVLVPRFGHGTAGSIARIAADGSVTNLEGLAADRRRIGLSAADGRLFETYFVKTESGRAGALAEIRRDATETPLASFAKPVAVCALGGALYVSDQDAGAVFRCTTSAPSTCTRFAAVPAPDLLAAGPAGSLYTGGKDGDVRRVDAHGVVTTVAHGRTEVRGVAWDGSLRLFVARRTANDSGRVEVCTSP
jgi:hypothetical protein